MAQVGARYKTAQVKAWKVIQITGQRAWYNSIQEAHVNMQRDPGTTGVGPPQRQVGARKAVNQASSQSLDQMGAC